MKAISLFSGGLDSQMAVCVIKEQGIDVVAINFVTPFFGAQERTKQAAKDLGIEFHFLDIGPDYMDVLKKPVYGYGKNMNPCIDCHAYMFKRAGEYLQEFGASFLISGEVLGQRPMSQNKSSLQVVNKLSGQQGIILRPLSAKLLAPTIPETEGWVDRSRLLDISGRSRARQMQLAEHYGIKDYPSPAGGCLLTQENFAKRLRLLLALNPDANAQDTEILKTGRHLYLNEDQLLVIGRNHDENIKLQELANEHDILIKVTDRPGPLGLLRLHRMDDRAETDLAARIVARYSDARLEETANMMISKLSGEEISLQVVPLPAEEVPEIV
ncbi:MAG TPA: tRNA 4-thiouridine(8) synthase ThiI [Syntrophomonas sp.]|nr:tRNA 4-thiouridine(8) synthase ThiI [Syntrophomonas sp.]